jgi:hypothetical protein
VIELMNRGELDAAASFGHPDILFVRPGGLPSLTGREAFRSWMEPDAFEAVTYELLEMESAGRKVLGRIRSVARGAGSGIELDITAWAIWTFDQDRLITAFEYFLDHDESAARETAGLKA